MAMAFIERVFDITKRSYIQGLIEANKHRDFSIEFIVDDYSIKDTSFIKDMRSVLTTNELRLEYFIRAGIDPTRMMLRILLNIMRKEQTQL